jgi:hypothetical protein
MELSKQSEILQTGMVVLYFLYPPSKKYFSLFAQVELLEAELKSHEGKHNEAKVCYLASISSAQKSGFIHEQGLACEFAGIHCRNTGDNSSARNFFDQAKLCYTEWGSQIKVDSITRQLDLLQCQSTGMNSPLDD